MTLHVLSEEQGGIVMPGQVVPSQVVMAIDGMFPNADPGSHPTYSFGTRSRSNISAAETPLLAADQKVPAKLIGRAP